MGIEVGGGLLRRHLFFQPVGVERGQLGNERSLYESGIEAAREAGGVRGGSGALCGESQIVLFHSLQIVFRFLILVQRNPLVVPICVTNRFLVLNRLRFSPPRPRRAPKPAFGFSIPGF